MNIKLDLDGGWSEAVAIVSDLDQCCSIAENFFGWQLAYKGIIDNKIAEYWKLKNIQTSKEALYFCENNTNGLVRFITFTGCKKQKWVRTSAMPWDTGGIFSLMVRTQNIKQVLENANNFGWTSFSEPIYFEHNNHKLSNVIIRGPDGINLGIYERINPRIRNLPKDLIISSPFNCMQIIQNKKVSVNFHQEILGFGTYLNRNSRYITGGKSNFGIPQNLLDSVETKVAIMHPRGKQNKKTRENGRVELVEWGGLTGNNFTNHTHPPNFGLISIRWPISDLNKLVTHIENKKYKIFRKTTNLNLYPYGRVAMFGLKTPDGTLYEFFQPD